MRRWMSDIKMRAEKRNSIWIERVSGERFSVLHAHRLCWCSNEYRWTCQRIRFWWFTFSFSDSAINTNLRLVLLLLLVCRRDQTTFTDDCKYWSPLEAGRMPNPYRWCRMPISKLMANGAGVGWKSHLRPELAEQNHFGSSSTLRLLSTFFE